MKNQPFQFITRRIASIIAIAFFSLTTFVTVSTAQSVNHDKSYFQDANTGDSFGNLAQTSPGDDIRQSAQRGLVSDAGNVAVIDGLYKAFAKGDIPGALVNMDPTIAWNEAESFPYADRNPYIGPQAVLEGVFARIGAEWEYWNLTGIELHEMSNNKVLATLRYQAKYKKNGATIDNQTAHLWTLKDGKITSFQQFTDTKQIADAIIR